MFSTWLGITTLLIALTSTVAGHAITIDTSGPGSPPATGTPLPLLIWHGLGDTYDADGLMATGELAQRINPGTVVYNIRLANDSSADRRSTFFGNVTEQIAQVCADIAAHPVLGSAAAVNALGFSQGGQFLRGYVERCNAPPVHNLVTFGSQHNGIAKFQMCRPTDFLCKGAEVLLKANTWSAYAQGNLVPAQYYRDSEDLASYLNFSNFLADVNNERVVKSAMYKGNMARLNKFVMYVFEKDETVVPKESGWFAEFNATSKTVTPLRNRTLYDEDWLGLRHLDRKGGLVFETAPGKHMELSEKVLNQTFSRYFGLLDGAAISNEESIDQIAGPAQQSQSLLMADW